MLDQLKELVKHYAGEPIINNADIPNDRNDEAVTVASESIFSGLKNAATSGNMSDLTSLFKDTDTDVSQSPVVNNIQGGFVENLKNKFGLDHGKASNIASSLIPVVLRKFINKTNDPTDTNFDLTKMLAGFTGGNTASSGSSNTTPHQGEQEGGLFDKLKGLFN